MGNLKKLLTRLFNPKKYWIVEINKAAKNCQEARDRYNIAKKYHKKRSDLHFELKLAEKKFNEIYQQYYKVVWEKEI